MNNIYWKLQSVNQTDELEIESKEYNLYREHYKKDYATRELMSMQETVEHYRINAFKNPLFSRIFSLTVAIVEDEIVKVIYYTGNEKDLIQTFLNTLKKDRFKDFTVTHFGAEYVLPYLGTRMDKNGIKTTIPSGLQYKGLRPWNLQGFCVRDYYSGAGNYKNNLKELAWIYGLDSNFIEPVDEFTYYKSGQLQELKDSAVDEIYTLVNVHRSMMGENIIEEFTCNEFLVENVEEVKPVNFLSLLWECQAMTLEIRAGLEKQLKKKKLTKRDREIVREIILGVYTQNDFINGQQDSKATIEKKTKEVDNFLATI
ncbi:MAG TPA: hypothetical protein VLA48_02650 [Nitrososphaeraceae archaeon]|nr:hypothetical protein [Nitrososphaeraceae archaeon]